MEDHKSNIAGSAGCMCAFSIDDIFETLVCFILYSWSVRKFKRVGIGPGNYHRSKWSWDNERGKEGREPASHKGYGAE